MLIDIEPGFYLIEKIVLKKYDFINELASIGILKFFRDVFQNRIKKNLRVVGLDSLLMQCFDLENVERLLSGYLQGSFRPSNIIVFEINGKVMLVGKKPVIKYKNKEIPIGIVFSHRLSQERSNELYGQFY